MGTEDGEPQKAPSEPIEDWLGIVGMGQVANPPPVAPPSLNPNPWKSTSPQEVVEYASHRDFEVGRENWIANGWRIATVTEVPQSAGCARIFTLGLLALVVRPQAHVLVVYGRRNAAIADPADSEGASPAARRPASVSAELVRLAALHERGALTNEEFEQAKRAVLGGN